ncbi:spore germination protein [Marinicrinis lubricantis]|uniref:Spore germination protein n=1 Tax=Marinicrinis lubricantis TaxID=2086470 RepID=A0ABW1IQ77_9BACL
MSIFISRSKKKKPPTEPMQEQMAVPQKEVQLLLHSSLAENIQYIEETMGKSDDLIIRYCAIPISGQQDIPAAIIYIDGLTDQQMIQQGLIHPITQLTVVEHALNPHSLVDYLKSHVLMSTNLGETDSFHDVFNQLLDGRSLLLLDGFPVALTYNVTGGKTRNVAEPSSETVIRGPKEAFTETMRTNTSMIRRRIRDPHLRCEELRVGKVTKTDITLMYIEGIVNESVLQEVRKRLGEIDIDGVLESGYIEELIDDKGYSPFPRIYYTERPDVASANILEGRVAIITQGTPFVLIAPTLFIQFFHAAEDYYQRFDIASLIRLLRFLCFFIALLAPSLYIAITTFHQEMLPTQLLISLSAQREGTPFPAFVEAVIMEIAFEILREAGVRMPRAVGQTVSIVGALVIGQAAVDAGIVSAAMVIIVSITAIANFVTPNYNLAIAVRILRFLFMLLGATFGLYGITIGLIAMVLHLTSLSSFGLPYMSPMAPLRKADKKDAMIRFPWRRMIKRPSFIEKKNKIRQKPPKSSSNK